MTVLTIQARSALARAEIVSSEILQPGWAALREVEIANGSRQDVISDSLLRRRVHDERMRERPKFIQVDEVARTHAFRFEASGMGKRLRNGIRASRG